MSDWRWMRWNYVRSTQNSTQKCKIGVECVANICKIYAKFNAKYVRSTLNSTQIM